MKNKTQKKMIQVGSLIYRGDSKNQESNKRKSIPLMEEWTPELQKARDKFEKSVVEFFTGELVEFILDARTLIISKLIEWKKHNYKITQHFY